MRQAPGSCSNVSPSCVAVIAGCAKSSKLRWTHILVCSGGCWLPDKPGHVQCRSWSASRVNQILYHNECMKACRVTLKEAGYNRVGVACMPCFVLIAGKELVAGWQASTTTLTAHWGDTKFKFEPLPIEPTRAGQLLISKLM